MGTLRIQLKNIRRHFLLSLAWLWRRLMYRTTFIAVTGSVGKTTCKEAIAEVLSSAYPTLRTRGGNNHFRGIARTILRVRPWHKYAVVEIGLDRPGQMATFARTVRPDIAVWIAVAKTHTMMFGTLENTAREKSLLVESLRPGGIAILNDENPYIASYSPPAGVTTIYYGNTKRSRLSASNVSSRWPERLTFRASLDGEELDLATQFVGEHWVNSILPALVVSRLADIPLRNAAEAIGRYEPMPKRMSPQILPNGAMMLRDERNGSVDTLAAAMKVMADATAPRKFLILTDVSDSPQKPRRRLTQMGRTAARVADAVMFVGEHSEHGARGAIEGGMSPDQVWSYYNVEEAADRLRAELRPDDLVMLRGRRVDHMQRLYLNLIQDVKCWRNRCNKSTHCEVCRELTRPRNRSARLEGSPARFIPEGFELADIRARFTRIPKGDRL